jgi:hypothetical protein
VSCFFSRPPEQLGPPPQEVPFDLLVSRQSGEPLEQSIFPVLHGLLPHEAPALQLAHPPLLQTLPEPHDLPLPQSLSAQSAFMSQSSSLPFVQFSACGWQMVQLLAPCAHRNEQGSLSVHPCPSLLHVWMAEPSGLQRLVIGLHWPPHTPSPIQT